jgi:hypothetical protein
MTSTQRYDENTTEYRSAIYENGSCDEKNQKKS